MNRVTFFCINVSTLIYGITRHIENAAQDLVTNRN